MAKKRIILGLEATEGGAARHVKNLVRHLDLEKFDVTLILGTGRPHGEPFSEEDFPGIALYRIPMARSFRPYQDWVSMRKIKAVLRRNPCDVLHSHSTKAGFLFRLTSRSLDIPLVVYTPHSFYFQGVSGIRRWLAVRLEKWLGRRTDRLICVSQAERKLSVETNIVPENRLVYIPNAIAPDFLEMGTNSSLHRERMGIGEEEMVFGWVGRLVEQKNPQCFLDAAAKYLSSKPAHFWILGEGPLKESLRMGIQQRGLDGRVHLLGHQINVAGWLREMNVLVSTSRWEAAPYALLEGLAMKKEILASDIAPHRELLPLNDRGNFFDPINSSELCFRMSEMSCGANLGDFSGDVSSKDAFESFVKGHECVYLGL